MSPTVGLLKNLSIPMANKILLGEAGLIQKLLVDMDCLKPERDIVGSVQGGAAGVVKNLCKNNGMPSLGPTSSCPYSCCVIVRAMVSSMLSLAVYFLASFFSYSGECRSSVFRCASAPNARLHQPYRRLGTSNRIFPSTFSRDPVSPLVHLSYIFDVYQLDRRFSSHRTR